MHSEVQFIGRLQFADQTVLEVSPATSYGRLLADANAEIKLQFHQRLAQEGAERFSLFDSGNFRHRIGQLLGRAIGND